MAATSFTPEILADIETPGDTRLSPDGKYVVYVLRSFWIRRKELHTASLWIAEVGKENSSRQLTQGNYHDTSPTFSPDGKFISFLSDRAMPGKAYHLYLLPSNGGEALPLTDIKSEKGVSGAFSAHKWSRDGKYIAFTSPDERTDEKKKRDEAKDDAQVYGEAWDFYRLRIIEIETKKVRTLFEEELHVMGFDWSPDGKQIAFVTYKTVVLDDFITRGATVNIINIDSKKTRVICQIFNMIEDFTWHRDVLSWKNVAITEGIRLYQVSALLEDAGHAEAKGIVFGEDEDTVGLKLCGDEIVFYCQKGLADILRLESSEILFSEETDILRNWDALVKGDKTTLVVTKGSTGVLEEVFSISDGKTCQLSSHNKSFADLNIGDSRALRCKADDGLDLDGVICTPKALIGKKGPHPTAVIIHGGPHIRVTHGTDWSWRWTEWMLALGYIVLLPNYRGSCSRGSKFAHMVHGNVDSSYGDIIALVKQGIKEGIVDPAKVAVSGWSHGGFLTYLSIARDSTFHFAGAIAGAGITQWDAMNVTNDIPSYWRELVGSVPWEGKQDQNVKANPIFFVKDVKTPLLMLHGENDTRTPKEQAVGFHRGMMAYGKESTLVIYPREGHWGFERAHYIDMLKRIKEFLGKHLA